MVSPLSFGTENPEYASSWSFNKTPFWNKPLFSHLLFCWKHLQFQPCGSSWGKARGWPKSTRLILRGQWTVMQKITAIKLPKELTHTTGYKKRNNKRAVIKIVMTYCIIYYIISLLPSFTDSSTIWLISFSWVNCLLWFWTCSIGRFLAFLIMLWYEGHSKAML